LPINPKTKNKSDKKIVFIESFSKRTALTTPGKKFFLKGENYNFGLESCINNFP